VKFLAHWLNRRPRTPGRVAVLRTDRLGDLLLTTPLLRALAAARWEVSVVCPRAFLPVLEGNPHVADAMGLEDICPLWPADWRSLARHLRAARYDALLIPQAKPPALMWASLASGTPYRLVLYGGRWASWTFHARVPNNLVDGSAHYARQVLSLGAVLGASVEDIRPEIFLHEAEVSAMRQLLQDRWRSSPGPLVVIHAGGGHLRSGARSSACNLTADEYARLSGLLLQHSDAKVVVTGGQDEVSLLEKAWTSWVDHPRCWFAVGRFALRPFAALLRLADLTIVGSTGPLHLASAVGGTTLSPFCPMPGNNAVTWGNTGGAGHVLERSSNSCPRCQGQSAACGDFAGEINAVQLFDRACAILKISPSGAPHRAP
jgi:ADP-heptose:LPS heptosyltransferase